MNGRPNHFSRRIPKCQMSARRKRHTHIWLSTNTDRLSWDEPSPTSRAISLEDTVSRTQNSIMTSHLWFRKSNLAFQSIFLIQTSPTGYPQKAAALGPHAYMTFVLSLCTRYIFGAIMLQCATLSHAIRVSRRLDILGDHPKCTVISGARYGRRPISNARNARRQKCFDATRYKPTHGRTRCVAHCRSTRSRRGADGTTTCRPATPVRWRRRSGGRGCTHRVAPVATRLERAR